MKKISVIVLIIGLIIIKYWTLQFNFTYSLRWVTNTAKPDDKKEDIHVLQVGKNLSKYYSKGYFDYMNFVVDYMKKNPNKAYPGNTKLLITMRS